MAKKELEEFLIFLIDEEGVDVFLVGSRSGFDRLALSVVKKICSERSDICYNVIYDRWLRRYKLPEIFQSINDCTYCPEGLDDSYSSTPFKSKERYKWMRSVSDIHFFYSYNMSSYRKNVRRIKD